MEIASRAHQASISRPLQKIWLESHQKEERIVVSWVIFSYPREAKHLLPNILYVEQAFQIRRLQ